MNSASLIGWISDTRPQTCTDLQSLVKRVNHRCIVTQYAVKQGCVRLRGALNSFLEAIFTVMVIMNSVCMYEYDGDYIASTSTYYQGAAGSCSLG